MTLLIWECTNSNNGILYVNDNLDLIYKNDTSFTFYSKKCFYPNEILKYQNNHYINSKAFFCTKDMNVLDYKIKLDIIENKKHIFIESNDTCFVKFFGRSFTKFKKIENINFRFQWDSLKIQFYNDSKEIVKTEYYKKNKIDKSLLTKLWVISNIKQKQLPPKLVNNYVIFSYYENDAIVFEKKLSSLPCWYNEIK